MSVKNLINENIVLCLSDLVTGQSLHSCLKLLMKSQFWSRDQIIEYQNMKLRKLITHACLNVPFYRDLFHDLKLKAYDIQKKEDLIKLPIITKDNLKKNKGKHIATNLKKKNLIFSSSSGSTGEPFQFFLTKKSYSFLRATSIRSWYWMGYRLGDKYVKISMNPRSSKLKKIQDRIINSLYLSANQLNFAEFKRIEMDIRKSDPKFIRCYPVPLAHLAQLINHNIGEYNGSSLKAINTTGSTLHDETRNEIENVFKVKIFDSYGCEGGSIIAECPTHSYYHPAEEYAISEFIEDNYTLSSIDRPLRHITTDLHNYASPFIRYDTQDYVTLGDQEKCSCGRNFMNIKKIKGRDSDILVTPSGKYLIVENFVAYFEWIREVDQIQVVQEELNRIIIKLVVNEEFNNEVLNKIRNYWTNYIGNDVNVKVETVEKIELTPSGKRRTVIRNPKIYLNGQ